jgi:hypothetical protein
MELSRDIICAHTSSSCAPERTAHLILQQVTDCAHQYDALAKKASAAGGTGGGGGGVYLGAREVCTGASYHTVSGSKAGGAEQLLVVTGTRLVSMTENWTQR